jgi:hypothetical protein
MVGFACNMIIQPNMPPIKYNGRPVNYVYYNGRPTVLEAPNPRPYIAEDYDHFSVVRQPKKRAIKDFVRNEIKTVNNFHEGYDVMQDHLNRQGPDKYPILGAAGRGLVSSTAGLVNVLSPSAITRTDGPKERNQMSGVPLGMRRRGRGGGRGRRRNRGGPRSRTMKTPNSRRPMGMTGGRGPRLGPFKMSSLNPRISPAMLRAIRQDSLDFRRGSRPRTRVITAPLASGVRAPGSRTTIVPTRRGNMNCSRIKTRIFLGALLQQQVTGDTGWFPSTFNVSGQWFFQPGNNAYWPSSSPLLALSRLYQFFYLNNVSFELESNIQPGQTNPLKLYHTFVEDPNIGETFISGYTTGSNVSANDIMKFPLSKSEPCWQPVIRMAPPQKWYKNRKYTVRSYCFNELIVTDTNDTVAQNKQSIPFGLFLKLVGPTPVISFSAFDIFINLDVEFCDLAPSMTFDIIGGTAYSDKKEKKDERKLRDTRSIVEWLGDPGEHTNAEPGFELLPSVVNPPTLYKSPTGPAKSKSAK